MFKLVLEKAEEPEIKLPTFVGSSKKQESYRKISNIFLDSVKCYEKDEKEKRQYGGGQC